MRPSAGDAAARDTIRVGINLCWLVPGVVGGSEQATVRALAAVADLAPEDLEVVLFALDAFAEAHPELVERFETHTVPVPGRLKPLRVAAEHTWLPWMVRRHRIDVVHDAGGTSPGAIAVPRVLTIHDIQPLELPGNFPPVRVAFLRWALPRAVAAADLVVVPSDFVKTTVVRRLGVDPDAIRVVPWSCPDVDPHDGAQDAARARAEWGIDGPFALLPAITYPHKAHTVAVRAFDHLRARHPDLRLVLAGGEGPAEADVRAEIERLDLGSVVVRTGRLPSSTVVGLLADADLLLFPSRYEGFGIPALEAMAVDTPAIVSDAGALPEVVGAAGVVVAVDDDAQLAVEVHRILTEPAHRDRLIEAGRSRATAFDGSRTADGMLAAYRSAATGR